MHKKAIGLALGLALGLGCASTQVTSAWRSPQYTGQPPHKVLVVAITPEAAYTNNIEQTAAAKLQTEGIQAAPFSQFRQGTEPINRQEVKQIAMANGFDGVLVARFKGTHTQVTAYPGAGYGPYFDAYNWGYGPDDVEVTQEKRMETTLFDLGNGQGKMIWSATSNSIPSGAPTKDLDHYVSVVLDKMSHDLLG